MNPVDDARRLIELLDLTELGDACRSGDVAALVRRGRDRVAALCVWPQFVGEARRALGSAATAVATVINFPGGGADIERAVEDTQEAVRDGAREIDLVMPWRALLAGDEAVAGAMIAAVRAHLPDNVALKVILETGELASAPMIRRAAEIAIAAGADFLKTSTGKTPTGASLFAARIVLETIAASGRAVGFKASGGVRTAEQAAAYLALAEEIMGKGWARPATFRIGASLLLETLEQAAGLVRPKR